MQGRSVPAPIFCCLFFVFIFNKEINYRGVSSVDFATISATNTNKESAGVIVQQPSAPCLLCSSIDGVLLCVDMSNRVIAAIQIDSGIRCVRGDYLAGSNIAIVGCTDGSIRVLSMETGLFREVNRHNVVHIGGVTALSTINQNSIVSGGEDGNVRVWTIKST